jgi:hypothetical protein
MSTAVHQGEIKRNIASLIGGIFVAIFVFVLWLLVLDSTGPWQVISGLIVAGALGLWVRLADL